MRIFSYCLALLFSVTLMCPIANAHPGRTDSSGGHYNRKTGVYHYHSGGKKVSKTYRAKSYRKSRR